jgi:ABC-2 type transport system ATP-binding protein
MLELQDVSRAFGPLTALDDVSFEVRPGRMTGFIGANGAGKTTAMRIVLGVLPPDRGQVRWQGGPVTPQDRQRFGYMPEERGLYPKMRVLEQLVFFGQLLAELDLTDRAGDRLESLSLGNQQRAQVAAALIHDPALLVLDEPFSGLDPLAAETMAAMIRQRARSGAPVLFSSHQLELVERLCDDIVIIGGGRVLAAGPAAALREERAGARYRVRLDADAGWLRDVPDVTVLDVEGPQAVVELTDPGQDQLLLKRLLERGGVREFSRVVPTLAEIFREAIL